MDQPTHVIDPDGEVIIVLRNANSPFAPLSDYMIANMRSQLIFLNLQNYLLSPAKSQGAIWKP